MESKVILITGASSGIGFDAAQTLARQGHKIYAAARRIELMEPLKADGITPLSLDVTDEESMQRCVQAVLDKEGHIDVLVNNAGINKDTLLLRMTEDVWDEVIANNLKSAFNYTKAVSGIMARQRSGSIIFMGSSAGQHGNIGQTNYAASKGGLVGLAKSVAKELGGRGVRANVLAPGFIDAGLLESLSERVKEYWLNYIPLHRWGTKDEVAGVALFLASDLSTYVTGQVLDCCGGLTS